MEGHRRDEQRPEHVRAFEVSILVFMEGHRRDARWSGARGE